jgi:hypothetical protein
MSSWYHCGRNRVVFGPISVSGPKGFAANDPVTWLDELNKSWNELKEILATLKVTQLRLTERRDFKSLELLQQVNRQIEEIQRVLGNVNNN